MPRKKQNVEAYGKSWSPVDLPNLEKAIKLFERLDYIASHFADSLSGSNEIWSQINEKADIQNELQKMGIKLTEEQAKEVVNLLKQRQQENEVTKYTYKDSSSLNNVTYRSGIRSTDASNINWHNAGSILAGIGQQKYMQQQLNKNYEYFKQNSVSKNANTITKLAENKTVNDLKGSAKGFNTAASVLQIAADTFKKGVDTFTNLFKSGLERQKQTYENTFTNISVRTGLTRSQYYGKQAQTNNELGDLGLRDNIATSDVQSMWNTLASNGFSQEKMFEQAIDTVLTQKIVPYLDVTSQQTELLNNRLGGDFYKQIRGIGQANLQISKNNYDTQDVLNKLLDEVAPMSDEALQNLAQGSTELTAYANQLMAQGLTKDQTNEIIAQLYKEQKYSDQIMSSGSTFEKLGLIRNLQTNTNIYDPKQYNNAAANIASEGQRIAGMTRGYTDTMSGLTTNIVGSAFGIGYNTMNAFLKMNEKNISGTLGTDITEEQLQNYANQATNDFSSGKNQTNATLQNITVENLANELAVGEEWMGHWTDLIVTAIKGVGTLIITGVVGKGIGALAGLGGGATLSSASGLGAILGAAGPIALGIGGTTVALGIAANKIANSIGDKSEGSVTSANNWSQAYQNQGKNIYESTMQGLDKGQESNKSFAANKVSINTMEIGNTGQYISTPVDATKSLTDYFSNLSSDQKQKYGIYKDKIHWYTWGSTEAQDSLKYAQDNADPETYNKIKTAALSMYLTSTGNELKKSQVASALMIAALYQNIADQQVISNPIKEFLGFDLPTDKEEVKKYVTASGITEAKDIQKVYSVLNALDYYPMTQDAQSYMGYPTSEEQINAMKQEFNLHRQGLNEVPYDDYPALLHQGEAVLTASTTNELRNLIDTYRETNDQSVNYEAIIQGQTNQLIEKMDQIITAINSNQIPTSSNISKVSDNIFDSMIHIRNTRTI